MFFVFLGTLVCEEVTLSVYFAGLTHSRTMGIDVYIPYRDKNREKNILQTTHCTFDV